MANRDDFPAASREIQKTEEFPVGFPIDYQQQQEEEIHLKDYLHILLRRKWTAVAFFIIVVTTVTVGTYIKTSIYRSTVTMKIDREQPTMKFRDSYEYDSYMYDENYFETQYKILKSKNMARRVVRTMRLDQNPLFIGAQAVQAKAALPPVEDVNNKAVNEEGNRGAIDLFVGSITVEPMKNTRLVKVSFDSQSPELAAQVANTIARTYMDYNIESKFDATQQSREWLEKQLEVMRAKVEKAEEQVNKYAGEKGIIFVGSGLAPKEGQPKEGFNIVTQKLGELNTQLVQATSDRIAKESLYREMQKGDTDSSPAVLNNSLIGEIKKNLAVLENEHAQLSKIYKPDYPKMVRLKEQITQAKTRLATESQRIVSSIKKDYETALQRENSIKSTLEKYKSETLDFNEKMVQYQILQREAETNRELYNGLLQRLKETGLTASLTASNVQVLDRAEVPRGPFKPNRPKNVLLAIITGLLGGIGLAFFVEYLDSTVKTVEDVEKGSSLPTLGIVPKFTKEMEDKPMITLVDKKSPLSEAYRSLGAYIQFSSAVSPPKTILVTSARSGDGKTTTVINTAVSLASTYGKSIIVDTDLRKPQMHKIFDLDNSKGLSSFLTGQIEFNDGLIQKSYVPNLDVITAGFIPPNPSELISSFRMRDLIQGLFSLYSYVIIDSPPLLGLSDSLVLSTITDGVVLVVRAGGTPKESVRQSKKLLRGMNSKILGVVLNGIRETDLKYGSYSYYYTYYYEDGGYGSESKKRSSRDKA